MPTQRDNAGIGRWTWADGTPLSQTEVDELGLTNAGNAGNFFNDIGQALGVIPKKISPTTTPGAALDTAPADDQRSGLQDLLSQLQQQAATGSGSWEGALKAATEKSQATASALGQSSPGTSVQSSLRNIGNAQSAASQRAVGQENVLRAESQMAAQDQLGQLTGSMGASDVEQANAAARVKQQVGATNLALIDEASKNAGNLKSGISSAIPFSDGGQVPGTPKVFGNDTRNDVVPAKLTPGEIVVDIEHTRTPEMAAQRAYAIALEQQQRGGVQHLAGGGEAGGIGNYTSDDYGSGNMALSFALPTIGQASGYGKLRGMAGAGGPSIENGGRLDTTRFEGTRGARAGLQAQLAERAAGGGPSVVPQQMQNQNDDVIAAALAARGQGATAGNVVAGATEAAQRGAGGSASTKAAEQQRGQQAAAAVGTQARAQEMSLAQAQQQAEWANTMQNLGLSLANQAALRGMFAGAGQAATAAAGARGGGYEADSDNLSMLADQPFDEGSDPAEWDTPDFEQGDGLKSGDGLAHGGVAGYAEGGAVEGKYPAMPKPKNRSDTRLEFGELELETKEQRKGREYEEETDGEMPQKRAAAPQKKPGALSRINDFARSLGAALPHHFAEGGPVPDASGFPVGYVPPNYSPGPVVDAGVPALMPASYQPSMVGGPPPAAPPLADRLFSPDVASKFKAPPGMDPLIGPNNPASVATANAAQTHTDEQARAELGIKPRGEATKAPAAPPEAAPAAKPAGGAVGLPPSHQLEEGFVANEAQLAAQASTDAEVARARAQEAGIAERAKAQFDAQVAVKEAQTRARQQTAEAMTRWTAAQEEFNRIDSNVDPGRYWASRTTGQKILGIIGLALGAAGTGPDGINRAAQMMNQAIDRDLEAQKAEHELRLKKGSQRLQAAQTYYAMAREAGHDDIAATELAKAAALEGAALKADQLVAATNEPIAKAKGMALAAALHGGAIDKTKAAEQQTFENKVKNQTLNIAAASAAAKGSHLPQAEQSKAIEVKERTAIIRNNIEKAKAIIRRSGTMELVGTDETELKRLIGDIAQDSARLKDPNSTVKDQELVNAKRAIGVEGGEFVMRNSVALKLLESFGQSMSEREAEALRVRGLSQ